MHVLSRASALAVLAYVSLAALPLARAEVQSPEAQTAAETNADVLILGGRVHDGRNRPELRADVAIRGDRIVAIGDLEAWQAPLRIDARDRVVCPGFIDLHSHSDSPILAKKTRENLSYLTQGCTTVVTGNCGGGKIDVADYLGRIDKNGAGTNVAHLLPHGSIRSRAMGGSFDRAATDEELARMRALFERGMREGAFGMSTGLIYAPGRFASTDEVVACASVVAAHGGMYASHIRSEGDGLVDAVKEAIDIGRRAGCAVHVSHMKASVPSNWGKVREAAALIETARGEGLAVTADQYPYIASSTSLAALVFPGWALAGTNADLVRRLDDEVDGPKIRAAIRHAFERRGGYDKILIASYAREPRWSGLSIEAAARLANEDPVELVCRMQRSGRVSAVAFSMCEDDVRFVMQQPWVATASDGSSKVTDATRPHPRSYGTFPRKIGRYALEAGVVTLEAAIHSCTGLPADILGLEDRGRLEVDSFADIVVFDPVTLRDRATYKDPHRLSVGVEWLFVNGQAAIAKGEATGRNAGRALRPRPR